MISCSQYDYIEIVCMYRYPIKLTLRDSYENLAVKEAIAIEGVALDTQQNDDHQECIKIEIEGVERLIVLDQISTLEVYVENPHFERISFTSTSS